MKNIEHWKCRIWSSCGTSTSSTFFFPLNQHKSILFYFPLNTKQENVPESLIALQLPADIFFFFIPKPLPHNISFHSLPFYFSMLLQLCFLTRLPTPSKIALSRSEVAFLLPLSSIYSVFQRHLIELTCYLNPQIDLAVHSAGLKNEKKIITHEVTVA